MTKCKEKNMQVAVNVEYITGLLAFTPAERKAFIKDPDNYKCVVEQCAGMVLEGTLPLSEDALGELACGAVDEFLMERYGFGVMDVYPLITGPDGKEIEEQLEAEAFTDAVFSGAV